MDCFHCVVVLRTVLMNSPPAVMLVSPVDVIFPPRLVMLFCASSIMFSLSMLELL